MAMEYTQSTDIYVLFLLKPVWFLVDFKLTRFFWHRDASQWRYDGKLPARPRGKCCRSRTLATRADRAPRAIQQSMALWHYVNMALDNPSCIRWYTYVCIYIYIYICQYIMDIYIYITHHWDKILSKQWSSDFTIATWHCDFTCPVWLLEGR